MQRIGIRELRLNASVYLRRVAAGETIEVTDRGRPVARIVPIVATGYERLVAEGKIAPATGGILDVEPLSWPKGAPPLSAVIRTMRDEDDR